MYDTALVGECHVGADEDVICDCLTEDFDTENVCNYFFGLALEIGVDEGNVIVGYDNISECRKALFYSLEGFVSFRSILLGLQLAWKKVRAYLYLDLVR